MASPKQSAVSNPSKSLVALLLAPILLPVGVEGLLARDVVINSQSLLESLLPQLHLSSLSNRISISLGRASSTRRYVGGTELIAALTLITCSTLS